MKHLKRYNEDIDWEFDDEEDDLGYPIYLEKLYREEYKKFLKELKIGDRFNFTFNKKGNTYNSDGTIKYKKIDYSNNFGIEFDKYIVGHDGKGSFNGKKGHCWFFNNNEMNYGLTINKRV